ALSESNEYIGQVNLGTDEFEAAFNHFSQAFDKENGGFGIAPKFSSPHNLLFLLRYWKRSGDDWALFMVEKTLSEIRKGGIFDQIGYGFHRYSTDADWLVPHFEKMLYDQAMLLMAYTETYQATKNQKYSIIAEEILDYVKREMTSPEGGFYSAEDADSEGVEGKFYVWEKKEILSLLSHPDSEIALKAFNVTKEGNFLDEASRKRTGKNILHMIGSMEEIVQAINLPEAEVENSLTKVREILLTERARRIRPLKDTKILTDWNGLLIAALAKAGRVFGNSEYITTAEKALNFILGEMMDSKVGIYHRYMDGEKAIPGFIDDYAFLIWGLLELYESTFKPSYLERSIELAQTALDLFWDDKQGAFFFSGNKGEDLLVKQKEAYDGAIPSGNSVMALNLIRLSRTLANEEFNDKAEDTIRYFSKAIISRPSAFTMMLSAFDFALGPSFEIVVVGDLDSEETVEMISAIRAQYIPSKVILMKGIEKEYKKLENLAPYTKHHTSIDNKATAYICKNHNCSLPTNNPEQMLELLESKPTL
ncbi:MAG: thioredoxin domain-containing protein, partial [Candidatus Thorarchaeota archaeon]